MTGRRVRKWRRVDRKIGCDVDNIKASLIFPAHTLALLLTCCIPKCVYVPRKVKWYFDSIEEIVIVNRLRGTCLRLQHSTITSRRLRLCNSSLQISVVYCVRKNGLTYCVTVCNDHNR